MATSATIMQLLDTVPLPRFHGYPAFVAYLKYAHGIMKGSVPLLTFAASKASGALRDYYLAHLAEERDHADWMADDLKVLGEVPTKIDHAIAATSGAQYYYIEHIGPQALLGYMAAMEFRPMPMTEVEALEKAVGVLPVRTLRYHAENDPHHGKELAKVIDQQEEFADLICYSAFTTAKMLAFYLGDRIKAAGETK